MGGLSAHAVGFVIALDHVDRDLEIVFEQTERIGQHLLVDLFTRRPAFDEIPGLEEETGVFFGLFRHVFEHRLESGHALVGPVDVLFGAELFGNGGVGAVGRGRPEVGIGDHEKVVAFSCSRRAQQGEERRKNGMFLAHFRAGSSTSVPV